MAMQIRCRCGANLVVDDKTPTIVCAACQATVAVPQPDHDIALSETIPAFQARQAMQLANPPKPQRSSWPLVVGAVLVVGAGLAITVFAMRGTPPATPTIVEPPTPAIDAAIIVTATSPEELVVLQRAALARGDEAALAALLAPGAFAHGPDAGDVAYRGQAAAGMLRTLGPQAITSTWSKIARLGDVAWIVDELDVGGKKLATTQLAFVDGGTWRTAAWHVAQLVGNKRAYQLSKDGLLPPPAAITDQPDDDHQVHDAMRAAFATRQAFVDAFSDRADAIDLGSAPGERVLGGAAVKRAFTAVPATFTLHDGVAAGRVSDRVGWGAANVDYTIAGKGTQTFRVLAVLVRERAGWRIVLAQWSNAGPLP